MSKTYKLDCVNLVCPLPVARTKKKLNEMVSGDILEVSGDFGESGENIVIFCNKLGYLILENQIEKEKFFIRIQKP